MSSCFSERRVLLLSRSHGVEEVVVQAVWGLRAYSGEEKKPCLTLYAEGLKELLTLWNVFGNKVLFRESGFFFYHITRSDYTQFFLWPAFTPLEQRIAELNPSV